MDKEERMDEELQREAGTARPEEGDSLFDPMGNPIETEPPVPVEDEMEEEFPKEPPLLEVSYVLTEEELAQAFQAVGMYKVKGKRQWIYSFLQYHSRPELSDHGMHFDGDLRGAAGDGLAGAQSGAEKAGETRL